MLSGILESCTGVSQMLKKSCTLERLLSAPGIWLLTQLLATNSVVGHLYAPSLIIGATVGVVFGGSAAKIINSTILGNAAIA